MSKYFKYFVEGECEEKLINILKTPPINYLFPGKVEVFNVIQNILSNQRILSIKPNSVIVFVYDTDVLDDNILKINIDRLKKYGYKNIIHIQSINNFEEELLYSYNIKSINEIFKTQSNDEFKRNFIGCNNIYKKLSSVGFNINKLWSRKNISGIFSKYNKNQINDIKNNHNKF